MSDKRIVGVEIKVEDGIKTTTVKYSESQNPEVISDVKIESEAHSGNLTGKKK